jgi:hypothetical protein
VNDEPLKTSRPRKAEIARLDDRLAQFLKRATFIGMTPDEAKECASCHAELAKLMQEVLVGLPESESNQPVSLPTVHREPNREVRVEESLPWWGLLGAPART